MNSTQAAEFQYTFRLAMKLKDGQILLACVEIVDPSIVHKTEWTDNTFEVAKNAAAILINLILGFLERFSLFELWYYQS